MAFSPSFLDELNARNPIEDVVGQYVALQRRGSNLFGLCPFHSEKTASFSVAPDKGIYYCFGCHKGGGPVNFIMEVESLDYPDAVRFLAKRAGLEVPEDNEYRSTYKRQERLRNLCKESARFFHQQLFTEAGRPGLQYIAKRGLSPKTVTRFGLGFAPEGWSNLLDTMTKKGYTKEELLDAGLVLEGKNGGCYDRFRNRLMFPIIDIRGNIIGFGGRVMDDSKPKYLNSPETMIFNKRKNLFALNIAKKSTQGRIILTEGYMDAIALHQYGFDCAVASLGTALTQEHAQLLAKYTKQVVLTYDGDQAGQNATRRAIPLLEQAGIQVKVLRMQGAKDPDEFLKTYGADKFRVLLERSENQVEYRLQSLQRQFDLTADDQRVQFLREAAQLLASIPSDVTREVYAIRAAEAAGVASQAMKDEVKNARRNWKRREEKKQAQADLDVIGQHQPKDKALRYDEKTITSATAEERILACVIQDPDRIPTIGVLPQQFTVPTLGKAFGLLKERYEGERPATLASLEGELTPAEMNLLSTICGRQTMRIDDNGLRDCQQIIRNAYELNMQQTPEERMMAMRHQMQGSKGYGG